jgi:hypothetical protein
MEKYKCGWENNNIEMDNRRTGLKVWKGLIWLKILSYGWLL